MKVIVPLGSSRNLIATIAIGNTYYSSWEKSALPGWIEYCGRHGLGLVVFDHDLISSDEKKWKKATWQKMLIGETLLRAGINANNVCYLDTDILINPIAPNIFNNYDSDKIGLTSIRKNLPFPLEEVQRRLAFLRHTCYDSSYPLDSALFMSLEQLYDYHGLEVQADEACMGLIVFNVGEHAQLMRGWFDKYDRNVKSVTSGGDQTHVNYEIQNWGRVAWLDYRFQAIWPYEMAWKYPFLYDYGRFDEDLIRKCVEAAMHQNYFLHFAGAWHESDMWKLGGFLKSQIERTRLLEYENYRRLSVTGVPVGMVRPDN
ncbi:MAG: hypothetical protein RIR21_1106 [Pseudomonadota bacterium]|jgi:hypothetical protein